MKLRHQNRMSRNQGKRMLKQAGRGQFSWRRGNLGPEGLSCPICSPRPWGCANKREAKEHAVLAAITEHTQEQDEYFEEMMSWEFYGDEMGLAEENLITIDDRVMFDYGDYDWV